MQTLILSILSLLAFAANSVLGRLALGQESIDAGGFTLLRLFSAIVMMVLIVVLRGYFFPYRLIPEQLNKESGSIKVREFFQRSGSPLAALMLFIYAIGFSYAYIALDTATGALILYAGVQLTMNAGSIWLGHKITIKDIVGIALAFLGLAYLLLPYLNTPSIWDFVVMFLAGSSWAIYTLLGKDSKDAIGDTAANFIYTLPAVLLLVLGQIFYIQAIWTVEGVVLAVISGAVTSALGYSLWYIALRGLNVSIAAVIQLSVPLIAALAAVVFLSEVITLRLMIAGLLILGGIAVVIFSWPNRAA